MRIISFEGNIGAGKSTRFNLLRKKLDKCPSFVFIEEMSGWEKHTIDGMSYLEAFYTNPKKYCYGFQKIIMDTYVQKLQDIESQNPEAIVITDRSLLSQRAFISLAFEMDNLTEVEMYQLFDLLNQHKHYEPDLVLYIELSPYGCFQRYMKRARSGETLSMDYLTSLDRVMKEEIGLKNHGIRVHMISSRDGTKGFFAFQAMQLIR